MLVSLVQGLVQFSFSPLSLISLQISAAQPPAQFSLGQPKSIGTGLIQATLYAV